MSSIELASLRFEEKRTMGLTIADFAGNGCLILGDRIPLESNNQKLNWQCISDWNTDIIVNDHVKASNTCSNVMNNPILSVTWLANELKDRGYFLR
jgi:2-keto-4-pentenoate hydratase